MNFHEFNFRVAYADTDRMGVVYYANYFALFERGRTELVRNQGLRYRDWEEKYHIFLPAMESHCQYLAPAFYDDLLRIRTSISKLGHAHISFQYEVYNSETGKLLARGSTKHPFVGKNWKPVRVPQAIREVLIRVSPANKSS